MRVLITGVCGFVGSTLADELLLQGMKIAGIDNLSRPGSELNRVALRTKGVHLIHGDIRVASDLETLPDVDWVIDAAANPSVLAGVDGKTSSRQLIEHNLLGTINLLEFCKARGAGLILLSTSRVYSVAARASLRVEAVDAAYRPVMEQDSMPGISPRGVGEIFSTSAPISLYGATKLASEQLALEYGMSFGFPVWINRCGVLAGAGQFGRGDQGIFSFWIHSWVRRRPLKYIGFGGHGYQVRDGLHPRDLTPLLEMQMNAPGYSRPSIVNVGGGTRNSMSLAALSAWCQARFGGHDVVSDESPRPFDIPWLVMDSSLAEQVWGWSPRTPLAQVLDEIAAHAEQHPEWLDVCS